MKYESTILKRLIDTYGVVGNPRYISEIIKEFIVRGKECYPNLFTYQSDWLAHIDEFGLNPTYTVGYTGQSIYAPNTLERPVKSAILSGNTIKNLHKKFTTSGVVEIAEEVAKLTNSSHMLVCNTQEPLANNTQYLIKIEILNNAASRLSLSWRTSSLGHLGNITHNLDGVKGVHEIVATTPANGIIEAISFKNESSDGEISVTLKCVITPYQVGLGNIPFFDGLCSVKMPVLTTNNSNLAMPSDFERGYINESTGQNTSGYQEFCRTIGFIDVKGFVGRIYGGAKYNDTIRSVRLFGYDKDKKFVKTSVNSFDVTSDIWYIRANIHTPENPSNPTKLYNIYISSKNSYEPHKSNILSASEDVELRGIGGVRDTLDCLTGQVTERIGEIVLDGMEEWNVSGHSNWTTCYTRKYILPHLINKGTSLVSDKMMSYIYYDYLGNNDVIGISITNQGYICFKYLPNGSKPQPSEVSDYLKSNPITIHYPLETESIKTVDLTILDQNGQNVKQLMSFNGGTHFNTASSEGSPLPTVSVSVETDLEEILMMCSLEGNTL